MNRLLLATLATIVLVQAGCRPGNSPGLTSLHSNNQSSADSEVFQPAAINPCSLALALHAGDSRVDEEIRRLQQAVAPATDAAPLLERLGWMYVTKARASFDPGFYKLAEQCAACLDARQPGSPEALLLRGHVLQNLHRFKEAEPIARQLVARRGLSFDHGLLGDVLMEMGRLDEAIEAYQSMVDLKPDADAYARIAHIRWLRGDLPGALEVMRLATGAASPQAPESAAWVQARLAFYAWRTGDLDAARRAIAAACEFQSNYPPALLLQGRILLADGRSAEAVEPLLRAARQNPLPEYQWALLEALRAAGLRERANEVGQELLKTGAANDPRTFALFLATFPVLAPSDATTAVQLAERELTERADVHTHDALAWALAAAGRWTEARVHSERALKEGTDDARLSLHAGIIAAHLGRAGEAERHLANASNRQGTLLPSERARLESQLRARVPPREQTASRSDTRIP